MKIEVEKLQSEFSRDLYWTRIYFTSDVNNKKSTVLACASLEYLWEYFGTRDFNDADKEIWVYSVVEKWRSKGESIIDEATHYSVYAQTAEGERNGMEFLKNEVTP